MKTRFTLTACLLLTAAAAFGAAPPDTVRYATRAVDASRISHRNFIGGINSRLTVVHEMAFENPEAPAGAPLGTAVYEPVDRLWVGGIHSGAELTGDGGYEFNANGVNIGYDWTKGDLSVGVAANFTLGTIQSNEIDTKNKIEAANFGIYASHDPLCGLFYDVNATYGMSWNRSLSWKVAEGRGGREGRFSATSYGLGGNIGYGFDLPLVKVTPAIGIQWTRHTQDAYTEFSQRVAPHRFAEAENDLLEIPLAVRIGTSWQLGSGTVLSPELRAAYILRTGDRESTATMGTVGSSGTTILHGADDGKNLARIGAGLKANFNPSIDAFVDYNLEFKSGYRSSNFNTGMGVSF